MSYNTLALQVHDQALLDRIDAAVQQEARENPAVAATSTAQRVRQNVGGTVEYFTWPVALATEAEYASALAGDNPDPGGDEAVITDNMVLSAVQANWPVDP